MANKIKAEDFTIIKEDKNDFKNARIERGNLTSEFSIKELETDLAQLEKIDGEAKAQVSLSSSVIKNIGDNHPFVSKLSDEQLAIASYLYETKEVLKGAEKKVTQIKADRKKYKEVLDTIYEKFGFVKTEVK
jgi:septal ring factor EnvC (AmiA/AmiB activator)